MIPGVNLVTDSVIAVFLVAVPLYAIRVWRRARKEKCSGSVKLVVSVLTIFWLLAIYGSFVENRMLVTSQYSVTVGPGESKMRIAVIADIHLGLNKGTEWAEKVVRQVNDTNPDLVLVVGDMVSVPAGLESLAPFAGLKSRYGSFAVIGNWDYRVGAVDVRKRIESYGVEVLTNESIIIGDEGSEIHLVGLDDYIYGDPDWDLAMAEVPDESVAIAVGHEPDFAPAAETRGIDLVISGHTHGGQVRLPFIGAVPPLPIDLPQDFDRGMFDFGQTKLFISPGAGESGARVRILQPPEISVLEVTY